MNDFKPGDIVSIVGYSEHWDGVRGSILNKTIYHDDFRISIIDSPRRYQRGMTICMDKLFLRKESSIVSKENYFIE